ncbi:MAG: CoA ester lyase [Neisseriaceae bacterium]|nr:CoA ester lyase [Neisseriaceae bacterium]MBP6860947.1 CoA ester lyase [Neisseriaceae bacterium]
MTPLALPLRSLLFVPATHLERIVKAFNSGADAVVVDWEDAVAATHKHAARADTLRYLAEHPETKVWVRINAVTSEHYADDVSACLQCEGIIGVLLPKAEHEHQVSALAQNTHKPVLAMIETPLGLLNLAQIATAKGLYRLSYGALDLAQALGASPNTPGGDLLMHQVRFQLLLHSQVNGLAAPIDSVYPDFTDDAGLIQRAECWQQMGFAGMLCIHPRQIAPLHALLAPSPARLAWAKAVVQQADSSGQLAFKLDGEMVDAPVIARARQLLASQA